LDIDAQLANIPFENIAFEGFNCTRGASPLKMPSQPTTLLTVGEEGDLDETLELMT
jgi:hypothetical protein